MVQTSGGRLLAADIWSTQVVNLGTFKCLKFSNWYLRLLGIGAHSDSMLAIWIFKWDLGTVYHLGSARLQVQVDVIIQTFECWTFNYLSLPVTSNIMHMWTMGTHVRLDVGHLETHTAAAFKCLPSCLLSDVSTWVCRTPGPGLQDGFKCWTQSCSNIPRFMLHLGINGVHWWENSAFEHRAAYLGTVELPSQTLSEFEPSSSNHDVGSTLYILVGEICQWTQHSTWKSHLDVSSAGDIQGQGQFYGGTWIT